MNLSRKHRRLLYEQLITANVGSKCSRQFINWTLQNNLSIDEIRYLVNDGWNLYGNSVKEYIFTGRNI